MINRIVLKEAKAKEIIDVLAEQCGYRFDKIDDGEGYMRYNFYDDAGFEYNRSVYFKASKDDKAIIVYVNRKNFPEWIRDDPLLDEDIVYYLKSYIDMAFPHIVEG
jgi:hypothetical protein